MKAWKHPTKILSSLLFAALVALIAGACTGYGNPEPPPAPAPAPAPAPDPDPEPNYEPSGSLHDEVHDALDRAPSLAGTNISVRVEGSAVYLSGEVDTADQRQTAHDVAHSVEGVTNVYYDDLRVD